MEELLRADPDIIDLEARGLSPLRTAAWFGHANIVRMLLDNGADPMSEHPETGKTALDHAVEQGHRDVAEMLQR